MYYTLLIACNPDCAASGMRAVAVVRGPSARGQTTTTSPIPAAVPCFHLAWCSYVGSCVNWCVAVVSVGSVGSGGSGGRGGSGGSVGSVGSIGSVGSSVGVVAIGDIDINHHHVLHRIKDKGWPAFACTVTDVER